MNLLEIKNLGKERQGELVLSNINLQLNKGEIISLSGEEESGKTTLVKLIMGMLHTTIGEIFLFGKDAWRYSKGIKRYTGFVPEDILYYSKMRADKFFHYTMSFRKLKDDSELNYLCGLFSFDKSKYFEEMTYEENKIAAIINGLIGNPVLIIMDEPLVVLDKKNIRILMEELKRRADSGAGVLITCEEPDIIADSLSSAAFLADGEIKAYMKRENINKRHKVITAVSGKQEYFNKIGAKTLCIKDEQGVYLYNGSQSLLNQAVLLSDCSSCLIENLTLREQALFDYERWM